MEENESGILVHQGFLYRLSEHKKLWNLRGIYIHQAEHSGISVQIVKHDEIISFMVEDVEDLELYTSEEFNVCLNIYIDSKVLTLAATSTLSELQTMIALIVSIHFAKIDDALLQSIFYYSLLAYGGNDGTVAIEQSSLPRLSFENYAARAQLIISLIDALYCEINTTTNAYDCGLLAYAVFLFLKLLSQIVVAALCNSDANPAIQVYYGCAFWMFSTKDIVFRISHALISVNGDNYLFMSANMLPIYILDAACAVKHEKSLYALLKNCLKHHVAPASSAFEIIKSVYFGIICDASGMCFVNSIRQSLLAALWLCKDLDAAYEDYLHELNMIALQRRFKGVTLCVANCGSMQAYFLYKFTLLPYPSEQAEVLLKYEPLPYQLIQKNKDVINYLYRVKASAWDDNIIQYLGLVVSEYCDDADLHVDFVDTVAEPQLSLTVFSQDPDAPPGIACCYRVHFALESSGNCIKMRLAAELTDKADLQRSGKMSCNDSDIIETASINYSSRYDTISTIQENSDSFEHISNVNELKIRLGHQMRCSGCKSINADCAQPQSTRYRLLSHYVAFTYLLETGQDNVFEMNYADMFRQTLGQRLASVQKRRWKDCICAYMEASLSHVPNPNRWFRVEHDRIIIGVGERQISIVCDYMYPGNYRLFHSAKLLQTLLRVGERYKRNVILQKYEGKKFVLENDVLYLNFIVYKGNKACVLKGLENYM